MSVDLQALAIERVGARVRAAHRLDAPCANRGAAEPANARRGVVVHLSDRAPVAMVRFTCLCVAYVPLRRLELDRGPEIPRCEVRGCRNPRWWGLFCAAHPGGIGASFEPSGESSSSCVPSVLSGSAIDDEDSKARALTSGGARPAGVGASSPPPPGHERATALPPSPPSEPRRTGTTAGRRGRVARPAPSRGSGPAVTWTRERCIDAIRAWAERHDGEAPRFEDWLRADPQGSRPCGHTVIARFGSWSAGIAAAGFTPRVKVGYARWTREVILAALRAHHEATGRAPSWRGWQRSADDHPSAQTVRERFGSWTAALEAAGLTSNPRGPRKRAT